MSKFSKFLGAAVVAAVVGLSGSSAWALPITVCVNDTASTCAGGLTFTGDTSPSGYNNSTAFLNWNSVQWQVTAFPNLAQPSLNTGNNDSSFSLNTLNDVADGTKLYVWITAQGFTSPSGVNLFKSSFTTNQLDFISSVVETTFIDPSNGLFGGTQLATTTFTASNQTNAQFDNSPVLGPGPFSETELYVLTVGCGGPGNCAADAILTIHLNTFVVNTPEPLTLSLFGAGLAGMAGLRRRRKVAA